ncbi:MAG: phosphotyrosine protein phosphatase [Halobacteriovorax sp.]|nr:phosphotyrosine protein phosphatase [Halobacteriovorax sp.]|tara:strand:+ start:66971 stop:67435 length:465 start_codon:yes stop_codon:yes gene_type:complete
MKILFVCLGNICRSPTAEGVFQALVNKAGLSEKIKVDSAGTSGCHVGERADSRMRDHAMARGYELTSISRKFDEHRDFEHYDKIVVMDALNYRDVLELGPEYKNKIFMMTDFCKSHNEEKVPDPYYGGPAGFEKVLDIVTDASEGLLEEIKKEL